MATLQPFWCEHCPVMPSCLQAEQTPTLVQEHTRVQLPPGQHPTMPGPFRVPTLLPSGNGETAPLPAGQAHCLGPASGAQQVQLQVPTPKEESQMDLLDFANWKLFGNRTFRPNQQEAIRAALKVSLLLAPAGLDEVAATGAWAGRDRVCLAARR